MERNRMKKTIAIILAFLFLITVTAGAVSAMKVLVINCADVQEKLPNEDISNSEVKNIGKTPSVAQGSDGTSRKTIMTTSYRRTVSK